MTLSILQVRHCFLDIAIAVKETYLATTRTRYANSCNWIMMKCTSVYYLLSQQHTCIHSSTTITFISSEYINQVMTLMFVWEVRLSGPCHRPKFNWKVSFNVKYSESVIVGVVNSGRLTLWRIAGFVMPSTSEHYLFHLRASRCVKFWMDHPRAWPRDLKLQTIPVEVTKENSTTRHNNVMMLFYCNLWRYMWMLKIPTKS